MYVLHCKWIRCGCCVVFYVHAHMSAYIYMMYVCLTTTQVAGWILFIVIIYEITHHRSMASKSEQPSSSCDFLKNFNYISEIYEETMSLNKMHRFCLQENISTPSIWQSMCKVFAPAFCFHGKTDKNDWIWIFEVQRVSSGIVGLYTWKHFIQAKCMFIILNIGSSH